MSNTVREPAIEVVGLTKSYPSGDTVVEAVRGIDLRVEAGQTYGFLGPNGAGKTTTLRMLVGLVRPTSGSALVLGAPPGSPASLARVGALIESPTFYPFLSGRDNLRVLARYSGAPEARIAAVLEEVDLATRGADRFGTYSLGMKQRLGIAGALLACRLPRRRRRGVVRAVVSVVDYDPVCVSVLGVRPRGQLGLGGTGVL